MGHRMVVGRREGDPLPVQGLAIAPQRHQRRKERSADGPGRLSSAARYSAKAVAGMGWEAKDGLPVRSDEHSYKSGAGQTCQCEPNSIPLSRTPLNGLNIFSRPLFIRNP